MYVTSSLGYRALNLLPPNIFPFSGGPSRSRTQTYGTNHLSICISLFCSIFRPLPIQRLAIIAYGVGQAIPLLPHILRRRWLHRPTLHPNKSTLVLPSACAFPGSGSFRSEVSTSSSALVLSPWRRRLSFPTWSTKREESGDDCSSRG